MSSIKSLAIVALLAAIGVGLFLKINSMPDPQPPADVSGNWGVPPMIEMEGMGEAVGTMQPGVPPSGPAPAAGGTAPPFDPTSASQAAPPFEPAAPAASGGANSSGPLGARSSYDASVTSGVEPISEHSLPPGVGPPPAQNHTEHHGTSASPPHVEASLPASDPFARGNGANGKAPADQATGGPQHRTFDEAWIEAQDALERGNLAGALLVLSDWYGDPRLEPNAQRELANLLGQLAGTVIYSREHHLEPAYVVGAGETLSGIAAKYDVPPELLAKINGITDPSRLQPGAQLKVVRGPFSAVVNLGAREMVLVLDGRYAGRFQIGLGSDRSGIEGEYTVREKKPAQTYFGKDRTIDAGDPANPLGKYWLGLGKPLENAAALPFGIHGASGPSGLESGDPRGYIRLSSRDAADAYDILSVGSQVVIRR